jgi:hypothetical protein
LSKMWAATIPIFRGALLRGFAVQRGQRMVAPCHLMILSPAFAMLLLKKLRLS